jgi:hypothetical protein
MRGIGGFMKSNKPAKIFIILKIVNLVNLKKNDIGY